MIVSADKARAHVLRLMSRGFEVNAIADAAGISRDTVSGIAKGAAVTRDVTEKRILAVDEDTPIPGHRVPNHILMRLLDDLRRSGFTLQWIYKTAGVNRKFRGSYTGQRVSWSNFERIAKVHAAFFESDLARIDGGGDGATS